MKTEIVKNSSFGLCIFREEDGSLYWQGTFNGATIKSALPVEEECIILLDPDANKKSLFKNLFRINYNGEPRWVAELPGNPDAFMDMRLERGILIARSWSGYSISIDIHSGKRLNQKFTK